jgi:hypothetical protein
MTMTVVTGPSLVNAIRSAIWSRTATHAASAGGADHP